jgi:hypothetical protein
MIYNWYARCEISYKGSGDIEIMRFAFALALSTHTPCFRLPGALEGVVKAAKGMLPRAETTKPWERGKGAEDGDDVCKVSS